MSSHPSAQQIEEFIHRSFPSDGAEPFIKVDSVTPAQALLRIEPSPKLLRPGATISGPIMMTLADTAAWVLILHNLGLDAAMSVTSNLSISFLARPKPAALVAQANLLKLGKRLSVAEVTLRSEGQAQPVAHATVTYAVVSG